MGLVGGGVVGPPQGFLSRPVNPNRRPPVFRFTGPVGPVTGENRLNSNPNSNKFKNSRATGSDRFTGRFYQFEFESKFKSSCATGLPAGLTGLPTGFTGLPAGLTGLTGGP
jgi:hypothetical protein